MEENNKYKEYLIYILIFIVFVVISLINQYQVLNKRISELKAQRDAYDSCITGQNYKISELATAINNAKDKLSKIQSFNDEFTNNLYLKEAQETLNVNFPSSYCSIPAAPDVPTPTP